MPDHEPPTANVVPPHIQLIQMGQAAIVSRIVYAAAKLNLADYGIDAISTPIVKIDGNNLPTAPIPG